MIGPVARLWPHTLNIAVRRWWDFGGDAYVVRTLSMDARGTFTDCWPEYEQARSSDARKAITNGRLLLTMLTDVRVTGHGRAGCGHESH